MSFQSLPKEVVTFVHWNCMSLKIIFTVKNSERNAFILKTKYYSQTLISSCPQRWIYFTLTTQILSTTLSSLLFFPLLFKIFIHSKEYLKHTCKLKIKILKLILYLAASLFKKAAYQCLMLPLCSSLIAAPLLLIL